MGIYFSFIFLIILIYLIYLITLNIPITRSIRSFPIILILF